MVFIGIIVVLAAADIFLKNSIESQEESGFPRELKAGKGKIMLHKNHNLGFSFGYLKEKPELVSLIPLTATSFIGGMLSGLLKTKGKLLDKLALSVALGGAISNLYDRLVRHYVVDYFSIQYKGLKKVVFNLGDLFIFLGAALFFLSECIRTLKKR